MKSERNGVLSLFDKESNSDIFRLHRFVHQEVLASKIINKTMDNVESIVKKAMISAASSKIILAHYVTLPMKNTMCCLTTITSAGQVLT
jgi:hypothetical protein